MNISELLEDTPEFTRIEDPRARFYLDNFATIELWASVRREAAALVAEGLLDLIPVFVADAEQLGDDIKVRLADKGSRIDIRRAIWLEGVTISLSWSEAIINAQGQVSIYTGLRQQRDVVPKARQPRIVDIGASAQVRLGARWAKEKSTWPVWRWIRPDGDTFDEQELYRLARQELWRCWEITAPALDLLA